MNFQLLPSVDKNKIFMVKRSELEGRLDPVMALYQKKTTQFKYRTEHFYSLLKFNPQYGANEAGKTRLSVDEPRYIRITDIDEYGLLKNEIGKTAETIGSQYILKNNDILIARSGATVGKAYIHKINKVDYICFYAGYMIRFIVDEEKINPNYIFAYMQLGAYREWVSAIQRSAGQPNINAEEYKTLKIPIPPTEIQDQIVAKIDAVYATKKQKETDAQRLLDGVDDYLLGELGIELPVQEENNIKNRIFYRKLSEVSGGRFDAPGHHRDYSLNTKSYPMERFIDCVFINPPTSFRKFKSDSMATFIPMECVSDEYGEADLSQCRTVAESGGYTKFLENDLIWAKITPCMQNGKSAVVNQLENVIGFGSTEFHVFRAREGIDIRYIHALLRFKSLRDYARLYFSGSAGHQRVSDDFFKRLIIPKPPFEKQIQIAEHINTIRKQAKGLKQEAITELEQTKKEVEVMILGD